MTSPLSWRDSRACTPCRGSALRLLWPDFYWSHEKWGVPSHLDLLRTPTSALGTSGERLSRILLRAPTSAGESLCAAIPPAITQKRVGTAGKPPARRSAPHYHGQHSTAWRGVSAFGRAASIVPIKGNDDKLVDGKDRGLLSPLSHAP